MKVTKEFRFEAAHYLPGYDGKCADLHGHSYKLAVTLEGEVNEETAMVVDFGDIKKAVRNNVLDQIDHSNLNDVLEMMPTAENIAVWTWARLENHLPYLAEIKVWEGPDSYVTYDGY